MEKALENFRSKDWRNKQIDANKDSASQTNAPLVPKLIPFDKDNKPLSTMETIESGPKETTKSFEVIPWSDWLVASVTDEYMDGHNAIKVFQHAIMWTHRLAHGFNLVTNSPIATDKTDRPYPVSMQREEIGTNQIHPGIVKVVADADIPQGHLAIPLFCRKGSSLIIPREGKQFSHALVELIGKVKWEETGTGIRPRTVEKRIYCQPERRLPHVNGTAKAADYDENTDCHPFWHIRRSGFMGEINCDVVQVEITNITNSPMAELAAALTTDDKTRSTPTTAVTSFTVSIPFIVNTEAIAVGTELKVKLGKKPEEKRLRQQRKVITAFTQEASSSHTIPKT